MARVHVPPTPLRAALSEACLLTQTNRMRTLVLAEVSDYERRTHEAVPSSEAAVCQLQEEGEASGPRADPGLLRDVREAREENLQAVALSGTDGLAALQELRRPGGPPQVLPALLAARSGALESEDASPPQGPGPQVLARLVAEEVRPRGGRAAPRVSAPIHASVPPQAPAGRVAAFIVRLIRAQHHAGRFAFWRSAIGSAQALHGPFGRKE